MTAIRTRFFGDRAFYKKVLAVSVPIMIQNGFTQLVSLVDNVMVGSVGTEAMSGVSIVNEFLFVFNLLIFGAVSSAGLFTAQYHGKGDVEGVRYTFRFKVITNLLAGLLGVLVFSALAQPLISTFLHESASEGDLALTMELGRQYLSIMLVGLLPYALTQAYASTVRETGDSTLPMIASVSAVFINLALNSVLIFGLLGFPALGVAGAAIATVISRFAELLILALSVHTKREKYPFVKGAYASLKIPRVLVVSIIIKGLPIMLNEVLWAASVTARNSCYATRGLDVVAGLNISNTICNLFSVIYMAIGASIAIIVGNQLGAGDSKGARDTARRMLVFSLWVSFIMAVLLSALSPIFPMIYNTSSGVRTIAMHLIIIRALIMPVQSLAHSMYFTIRSGGKVLVTMLFDSVFMWVCAYPTALLLSSLTEIGIYPLFLITQLTEIIKIIIGAIMIKKVDWARRIVPETETA